MREPFTYHGKVNKVCDDGISLMLTLDLGFFAYVKNQRFTFLGIVPHSDPDKRMAAKNYLMQQFPEGADVIVETYMSADGDFFIEIVNGSDVGMSRVILDLGLAEFDENLRGKFGIEEKETIH